MIAAVEISIDFYPAGAREVDRQRLVAVLVRHLFPSEGLIAGKGDQPRYAWARGRSDIVMPGVVGYEGNRPPAVLDAVENTPLNGSTFYVGRKGGPAMIRVMEKVRDNQSAGSGSGIILSEEQKRARIEVTLTDIELDELGIAVLSDLRSFRLTTLQQRYFKFMTPTIPRVNVGVAGSSAQFVRQQIISRFRKAGVIGVRRFEAARLANRQKVIGVHAARGFFKKHPVQTPRGKTGTLVAFKDLNIRVHMALRHLSKRHR